MSKPGFLSEADAQEYERERRAAAIQSARDAVVEAAIRDVEDAASDGRPLTLSQRRREQNRRRLALREAVAALLALQAREEGADE